MGGLCTLALTSITVVFVSIQLFGWAFQPSYNNSSVTVYIDQRTPKNESMFEMQPGDFLPTFYVGVYESDDDDTFKSINDRTLFDFYYKAYKYDEGDDDDTSERIEAILCPNGPYWNQNTEAERNSALRQI